MNASEPDLGLLRAPMAPVAQALLRDGVAEMGLVLPNGAEAALLRYLSLLAKWNRVYNLTAVEDPAQMVVRHLLDSLSTLPQLRGPRILDVGSGAGLPGVPLALARPEWTFWLLDSSAKRTRFLTQALLELGIGNARVVRSRLEAYRTDICFNTVISRAFAALGPWLAEAAPLLCPDGLLLAMKGAYPGAELEDLPVGLQLLGVTPVAVPGLTAQRHLVQLTRAPGPAAVEN